MDTAQLNLILDALRLAQTVSQLVQNFTATASTEQLKQLVAAAHARGETIDIAAVNTAIDAMKASGTELDERIKALQNPLPGGTLGT